MNIQAGKHIRDMQRNSVFPDVYSFFTIGNSLLGGKPEEQLAELSSDGLLRAKFTICQYLEPNLQVPNVMKSFSAFNLERYLNS